MRMHGKASAHGSVATTPAKAGLKSGATQTAANRMFKNKGASARRVAHGVAHGKSGMPSSPTAKGRDAFKSDKQQSAFTNPAGVMQGAGRCKFVN